MTAVDRILRLLPLLALLLAAGCATPPDRGAPPDQRDIAALSAGLRGLGPDVDPEEADRAARIAFEHTGDLARAYEITDPPLIHNTKVNLGLRPRGLCRHWAEDMESRLLAERFRTLELHRAIANADNPFRIEHSTAIISRRGDTLDDGIVLDPWREGGVLHWVPTRADARYAWRPREEVLAEKRERLVARGRVSPDGTVGAAPGGF